MLRLVALEDDKGIFKAQMLEEKAECEGWMRRGRATGPWGAWVRLNVATA